MLKKLPKLKELSFRWDSEKAGPAQTAEQFWRELTPDALAASRSLADRFATLQAEVEGLSDGAFRVTLSAEPITDLTPLAGLPIAELNLGGARATDLTPLKGMALRQLDLGRSEVTDLSPLAGMPLKQITMGGIPVERSQPARCRPAGAHHSWDSRPWFGEPEALHGQ